MIARLRLWLVMLGGAVAAVLSAFYVGKARGKDKAALDRAVDAAEAQKQITDFHREVGELNAQNKPPRNRDDLVDRLRNDGL